MNSKGKAADVSIWCDELANAGNNSLSKKEYDSLLPTIEELHPHLGLSNSSRKNTTPIRVAADTREACHC